MTICQAHVASHWYFVYTYAGMPGWEPRVTEQFISPLHRKPWSGAKAKDGRRGREASHGCAGETPPVPTDVRAEPNRAPES